MKQCFGHFFFLLILFKKKYVSKQRVFLAISLLIFLYSDTCFVILRMIICYMFSVVRRVLVTKESSYFNVNIVINCFSGDFWTCHGYCDFEFANDGELDRAMACG